MSRSQTHAVDKSEATGLALVQTTVVIQQICLAVHAGAHRPNKRIGNRVAVGRHLKRISRKRVVGNEPVRVGSAFKIAGSGHSGRATREPEGRLGHFALGLGRRNCGMAVRTDAAANIPFGGRWRFGGPPTQAGYAISRGVRQLIRGRVSLSGSDKQSSETQPSCCPRPNS